MRTAIATIPTISNPPAIINSFVRLGEGEADIIARALLIHADADDYESQPAGEAGERLACAVLKFLHAELYRTSTGMKQYCSLMDHLENF